MRIIVTLLSMALLMMPAVNAPARADVVPGDVIDKSNYQKIEGLVPDYIVQWVKDGDLTMKIDELTFDPEKFLRSGFEEKINQGRYKIGENNILIDLKTGKENPHPTEIRGFPFPEPDINDPALPVQILHNFNQADYITYSKGIHENQFWFVMGRGGIEKVYEVENRLTLFDPAKGKYDHGIISIFRQPFDWAGTGSMALYYMDPLKDGLRYVYAPALRKVKRMSHRLAGSEVSLPGLDAAPDDFSAHGPRTAVEEGRYTFLTEKDALVPYYTNRPGKVVMNKDGEIFLGYTNTGEKIVLGGETPGWTGAPWHTPETVWVKERVYVFESSSINPNYRYGPCQGWMTKKTFLPVYKRITDTSGVLWKGNYFNTRAYQTEDGGYRTINHTNAMVLVDVRRDHGSVIIHGRREGGFYVHNKKDIKKSHFTRAGFIKYLR